MDNSSQRKIHPVSPTCEVPQFAGELTAALAGVGPTLALGQITATMAPSQVALVIATSASTGNSKEVALSAHALLSSARASNKFLDAKPGDTWSLLLPLTHVAAVNVFIRAIELGTLPVDLRDSSGPYPKVNFTSIVPTQLFRALNGDEHLLKHLQCADKVLVGGAALSQGLRNQAEAAGISVIATYGMTESSGGCVYDGTPLDGVSVEIHNGKICIKGPILATTYLNSPWDINDGWFESNDLGEIKNEKLIVIGRADDVIISGGENLSLDAIEEFLTAAFPKIQFAAFSLDDPQWGQSLHIAVVGEISDSQIADLLVKNFGVFAKPKGVHRMASLPLRGIGKVDRKRLATGIINE